MRLLRSSFAFSIIFLLLQNLGRRLGAEMISANSKRSTCTSSTLSERFTAIPNNQMIEEFQACLFSRPSTVTKCLSRNLNNFSRRVFDLQNKPSFSVYTKYIIICTNIWPTIITLHPRARSRGFWPSREAHFSGAARLSRDSGQNWVHCSLGVWRRRHGFQVVLQFGFIATFPHHSRVALTGQDEEKH